MKKIPDIKNKWIRRSLMIISYPVVIPVLLIAAISISAYSAAIAAYKEFKDSFERSVSVTRIVHAIALTWKYSNEQVKENKRKAVDEIIRQRKENRTY